MTFTFDLAPTPFGDALVVFSPDGIVRFDVSEPADPSVPWMLEEVTHRLGVVPEPAPGAADELAHRLDDYFAGENVRFDEEFRLDWRLIEGFHRTALHRVCEIPWGETASYGEIAVLAGSPGAGRAAGTACRNTPFSVIVPVHRVIRADGNVGSYGAHPEQKSYLLELEARAALSPPRR